MKHSKLKWSFTVAALAAMLVLGACKKKVAPPPPPPPPPPAPTASLSANPTTIDRGESATLTWQTSNANDVTITNLGTVEASGSRAVSPSQSTSYHLVAKGAGGTADATARVTVNAAAAPPPPPQQQQRNATLEELWARNVKDAYFDYDKYDIRADAQQALANDAAFFKQHPDLRVTVEGHCDERGSTEYNLALGDNRARAARDMLVQAGVAASQLNPISFGKEKPFCTESNEQCWQMNRRAHFVMGSGVR